MRATLAFGRSFTNGMVRRGTVSFAVVAVTSILIGSYAGEVRLENVGVQQQCQSVVQLRCDTSVGSATSDQRRDAALRLEIQRSNPALELDQIVIEADRPVSSISDTMGRQLSRPLVSQGEHSFAIGESAQCTCMNICPPPPFPCCACTDIVGSRLSQSPGWAPTHQ